MQKQPKWDEGSEIIHYYFSCVISKLNSVLFVQGASRSS